jgi:hypothetical protein
MFRHSLQKLYPPWLFFTLGLMQKQYERVKLHVTLMNTLFRSDDTESQTSRRMQKHRETFDATNILKVSICNICIYINFLIVDDCKAWAISILHMVSLSSSEEL